MNTEDKRDGFIQGIIVAGIVACFIVFIRDGAHEREAVQRGHAEYVLNSKDGTTTFTWKTNCVCP